MKKIKTAIYARVSTKEQKPKMQITALREYCKNRGWQIEHEFVETASGLKADRPERAKLLTLARQHKIDAIAVWKLDRWGRRVADVAATLKEINSLGLDFFSHQEAIDLKTPTGRAFAQLLAILAELEREWIRERMLAGMRQYREQNNGKWGRPATAQAHLETIQSLKRDGWSNYKIAQKLKISRSSVGRILKTQNNGE